MDAIQNSMNQLQKIFTDRMDRYQSDLQASAPSTTISNLNSEFSTFRSYIMTALQSLQEQINLLAQQTDNMEMHSRRKMLLLHGLPEESNEDTVAVLVKTVTDRMKISGFTKNDISRCHRMGRKTATSNRPRPLLLKLRDQEVRSKIWFSKTVLKGSGLTISEFLTKSRHDAFMAAREKYGVNKCFTKLGFVFVIAGDGKRHRISSLYDLNKISSDDVPKPGMSKETASSTRSKRTGISKK
ncbi:unnamed protein product [Diatraea saccharalis]|uniref:Uncharacterized protein n=1 Tax=Diatraea saccharalis TaxID=40085 RepID=A0A9N9N4I8_9NEOP|nr:unnamed protein product [Diatraea saccharalis]